jgi:alpha-D-xyloside xylohydrolase
MRAMVVEFPEDPACAHLERQYMLGGDLLVAPVLSGSGDMSYYVPEGTWTHFLTGEPVTGPRWCRERHGFLSVPLLARPGAVIPVGAVDDRPAYDYAHDITLRAYELADGARVTTSVPAPAGDHARTFVTSRQGRVIRVQAREAPANWQVLLVGVRDAGDVVGGAATPHEQGTLIRATGDALAVTLGPDA